MQSWIMSHLLHLGTGSGVLILLAFKLFGSRLIERVTDYFVDKVLTNGDTHDKALALALVKWAEAKIPDAGTGQSKFALVDTMMSTVVPNLSADQRKQLIEASVDMMEKSLAKAEIKLSPPPSSP